MLTSPLRWILLLAVLGGGLWLRTRDLAARPMHADEANQAVKTGVLLESGRYTYDPTDHHGPVLYYATLPVAWLRGEHSLAQLSESTVRLVPALAGTGTVLLVFLLAGSLGYWPALAAAALVAVSPPAVYYSRYFVQETLLLAFTVGAVLASRAWWRGGRARHAAAAGACLGLMQATKATAPLFAVAALLAWLALLPPAPASRHRARDLAVAGAAALAVIVAFYSSFGTHPGGLVDAVRVYGPAWARASTGAGHEKPWSYYASLFLWHREGGLVFQQLGFIALAGAGVVIAVLTRDNNLMRWAALYTGLVAVALSVTPYKTPWHAIHLVPGLAVLAAGALGRFGQLRQTRPVAVLLAGLALVLQGHETRLVAFQRAADERNPLAYVHASPDVLKYRALVVEALARTPTQPVRIISEESWPLPWYLRGLDRVGYWTSVPPECDGSLVIASASLADAVQARLHGRYATRFLGLRPGFTCVIFTAEP